ncbi:MAG: hypothetical protein AAFP84_15195, partial [Actinomycetota bacterium]
MNGGGHLVHRLDAAGARVYVRLGGGHRRNSEVAMNERRHDEHEIENSGRWEHPDRDFFLIDEQGWAVPFQHFTDREPALPERRRRVGRRTSVPRWAAAFAGAVLLAIAPSSIVVGQEDGGDRSDDAPAEQPSGDDATPAPAEGYTGNVNIGVYGDSYTSGEGADDGEGDSEYVSPTDQRHQSRQSPSATAGGLIAGANPGMTVTMPFAAASGAVSGNVHEPQDRYSEPGYSNTPQLGQVPADVDGVVVGFGGNDAKFAGVMHSAATQDDEEAGDMSTRIASILAQDPPVTIEALTPEQIAQEIATARANNTVPTNLSARLAMTYQDIRAAHPGAAMVVTNYPVAVDPNHPHGSTGVEFTREELTAVRDFAVDVNAAIAAAVAGCGCDAALADVSGALAGNEAGKTPSDIVPIDAWEHLSPGPTHQSREFLHPTPSGAQKMGAIVAETMARELGVEVPDATTTPNPGAVDMRVSPAPADPPKVGRAQYPNPDRSTWPGTVPEAIEAPPSHPDLPADPPGSTPAPEVDTTAPDPPTPPEADGDPGATPEAGDRPDVPTEPPAQPEAPTQPDDIPDPTDISFDPDQPTGDGDGSSGDEPVDEPGGVVVEVPAPADPPPLDDGADVAPTPPDDVVIPEDDEVDDDPEPDVDPDPEPDPAEGPAEDPGATPPATDEDDDIPEPPTDDDSNDDWDGPPPEDPPAEDPPSDDPPAGDPPADEGEDDSPSPSDDVVRPDDGRDGDDDRDDDDDHDEPSESDQPSEPDQPDESSGPNRGVDVTPDRTPMSDDAPDVHDTAPTQPEPPTSDDGPDVDPQEDSPPSSDPPDQPDVPDVPESPTSPEPPTEPEPPAEPEPDRDSSDDDRSGGHVEAPEPTPSPHPESPPDDGGDWFDDSDDDNDSQGGWGGDPANDDAGDSGGWGSG